jgi:hypothetical protein
LSFGVVEMMGLGDWHKGSCFCSLVVPSPATPIEIIFQKIIFIEKILMATTPRLPNNSLAT